MICCLPSVKNTRKPCLKAYKGLRMIAPCKDNGYDLKILLNSNTENGTNYLKAVHLLWKSYCDQMVGRYFPQKHGSVYRLTFFSSLKSAAFFFTWIALMCCRLQK